MSTEEEEEYFETVEEEQNKDDDATGSSTRVGRCRTYHNKKGYGFVQCVATGDVFFCHRNDIHPLSDRGQYRAWDIKLMTGEYIQFSTAENIDTTPNEDGTFPIKAVDVTGIKGGPLLFEHGNCVWKSYSRRYLDN